VFARLSNTGGGGRLVGSRLHFPSRVSLPVFLFLVQTHVLTSRTYTAPTRHYYVFNRHEKQSNNLPHRQTYLYPVCKLFLTDLEPTWNMHITCPPLHPPTGAAKHESAPPLKIDTQADRDHSTGLRFASPAERNRMRGRRGPVPVPGWARRNQQGAWGSAAVFCYNVRVGSTELEGERLVRGDGSLHAVLRENK
jgi:hypothetical protein